MADGQTPRGYWLIIVIMAMSLLMAGHVMGELQSAYFKQTAVCGVSQRLEKGCMELSESAAESPIQCASLCQENPSGCLGIVLDDTGNCYFHYDCGGIEATCTNADAVFTGYKRTDPNFVSPCQNGGTWVEATQTCLCGQYASGSLCESLPESCKQLRDWGVPVGEHLAEMSVMGNPVIAKVKCHLGSDFVHTYVSYNGGTSNYNATYQDYVDGFHRGDATFWLGLENMHRLTKAGVGDFVIVLLIDGVLVEKTYSGFEVNDALAHYEVDVDTWDYEGNDLGVAIGRCLGFGIPFSAWDEDHDGESSFNIAAMAGTGWWYDTASSRFCNLNGIKPLDDSYRINYIAVEFIDMTTGGYGNEYESTTLYLNQPYP